MDRREIAVNSIQKIVWEERQTEWCMEKRADDGRFRANVGRHLYFLLTFRRKTITINSTWNRKEMLEKEL